MYNDVIQERKAGTMSKQNAKDTASTPVEIEVTSCPECGTEWETVITKRRDVRSAETVAQM